MNIKNIFMTVLCSLLLSACSTPQIISSVQSLSPATVGVASAGCVGEHNKLTFSVVPSGDMLVFRFQSAGLITGLRMEQFVATNTGAQTETILEVEDVQNFTWTYCRPENDEPRRFRLVYQSPGTLGIDDTDVVELGLFFGDQLMPFDMGMNRLALLAQQALRDRTASPDPALPSASTPSVCAPATALVDDNDSGLECMNMPQP